MQSQSPSAPAVRPRALHDAGSNSLSAAAVFAGMSALPDRAAVEALVAGPPPEDEPGLSDLVDDALEAAIDSSVGARKRLVRRLVNDAVGGPPLSDAACVRMAVLVHNLEVRDVAWAQLSRERAEDHVALWQQVVARTPSWLASAPLCLLGMAAWVAGNGALQNCCIERVDRIDPTYTMADLLADINRRALPPHYWDELLREFRRHPGDARGLAASHQLCPLRGAGGERRGTLEESPVASTRLSP